MPTFYVPQRTPSPLQNSISLLPTQHQLWYAKSISTSATQTPSTSGGTFAKSDLGQPSIQQPSAPSPASKPSSTSTYHLPPSPHPQKHLCSLRLSSTSKTSTAPSTAASSTPHSPSPSASDTSSCALPQSPQPTPHSSQTTQ